MDYPDNSHKAEDDEKSPPKRLEKVVAGDAIRRKKSLGTRFARMFLSGDAKGVVGFVLSNVLVPAAKDMFNDAVIQGMQRMVYGESHSGSRLKSSPKSGSNGYVSYNRYSHSSVTNRSHGEESRSITPRARATHNFDEILLQTRPEAENVLGRLFDLVANYDMATVADLYQLVGIDESYTDAKWGWTDMRGSDVVHTRAGWLLKLPEPEPLNKLNK